VLIFLYIALGTKLAHKFILMMCVIGAVVSLWGAFAFFSLMSLAGGANRLLGEEVVPTGWIAVPLVIYLVMVVVYGWLGVLVHRGMRRLDGHR
jgi:sterol desaturase/sphingolipid hydroxylase (fatty acid hydroxylase superfamily)